MQVVAYVASGQVAFLPDRRHVVLRRPAQGPFDLSEPDESLFDLVAFGSQIIHRHALSPFRFGSRFEERRDVVFPVEILSSYAGERDQSPLPVGLQRPLADSQRKTYVLRVDSTAVRPRLVPVFQQPGPFGQRFQSSDEGLPDLFVDTENCHRL